MILSYDCNKGRVSLSTKKLEPTPGDMIHNPKLVFEKVFLLPFTLLTIMTCIACIFRRCLHFSILIVSVHIRLPSLFPPL